MNRPIGRDGCGTAAVRAYLRRRRRGRTINNQTTRQDGSVSVLVALLLPVLMMIAALAIDIAFFLDRGSKLQTAADAAALAGVVEVAAGNDPTPEINALLRANGIAPSEVNIISTAGIASLQVAIEEADVQLFFSTLLTNSFSMTRSATAEYQSCGVSCETEIVLGEPFNDIQVIGNGDGYKPERIGNRLYTINHHATPGARIVCVDGATNAMCPGYPKAATSLVGGGALATDGDFYTNQNPELAVVGEKIYFVGQQHLGSGVGCWDTATDTSCGYLQLNTLGRGPSHQWYTRMGGPALVAGKIYFFADDYNMYCVNPGPPMTKCSGYPIASGMNISAPPFVRTDYASRTPMIDFEVIDERTYWSFMPHSGSVAFGGWIHCFDTTDDSPCPDWPATALQTGTANFVASGGAAQRPYDPATPVYIYADSRLFVRYDSAMMPEGICIHSTMAAYGCTGLQGQPLGPIQGFDAADAIGVPANPAIGSLGLAEFRFGDRTYFPSFAESETFCHEWTTQATCGKQNWSAAGIGTTKDYGYTTDGHCLYGLGDTSIFWTFDANMNSPCTTSTASVTIQPCVCTNGTKHWGTVTVADIDLTSGTQFAQFEITVTGNLADGVAGPILQVIDLLDTDGTIDLEAIPTTYTSITIDVAIEAVPGHEPWALGNPPKVVVAFRDVPSLVE